MSAGDGGRFSHHEIGRVALLVNPAAGGGRGGGVADRAVHRLRERGVDAVVLTGGSAAESRALAARAVADPTVDALAVCGGDGMISLAVQEQAGSDTPLGIVPAGTGNDLAREYGIPLGDPEAAVDVVLAGRVERSDLGRANTDSGEEHLFASVLCAGFDSAVNRRVNEMRFVRGALRYVVASALTYPGYRAQRFRLTFDGTDVVEQEIVLSAYAITRCYGGSMRIAPDADRADGLLDVVYLEDVPKVRGVWHFRKVFAGEHVGVEGVVTRRCRTVRIEAAGVEAYADGDLVAPLPVTLDVLAGQGAFLVP